MAKMKFSVKSLLNCYEGESGAISDKLGEGWNIKSIALNNGTLEVEFDVKQNKQANKDAKVHKLPADVLAELIKAGFKKKMSGDWRIIYPMEFLAFVEARCGVSRRKAYELLVLHKWK